MARIQILELPTEHHGDNMTTPFLLILDQVEDAEAISTSMQGAKELSGARGILAFEETIEIPGNEITLTEGTEGSVVRLRVEPDLTGFHDAIEQAMTSAQQKINLRLGGNSMDAATAQDGGWLHTGWTEAVNNSGEPEPVEPAR